MNEQSLEWKSCILQWQQWLSEQHPEEVRPRSEPIEVRRNFHISCIYLWVRPHVQWSTGGRVSGWIIRDKQTGDMVIHIEKHLITPYLEQMTLWYVCHQYVSMVCFSYEFMFPAGTECLFCLINVKYLKQSCLFLSGDCQIISFHWLWALARALAFVHIYPCQMLVTQELYEYSLLLLLALHSSVQFQVSYFFLWYFGVEQEFVCRCSIIVGAVNSAYWAAFQSKNLCSINIVSCIIAFSKLILFISWMPCCSWRKFPIGVVQLLSSQS